MAELVDAADLVQLRFTIFWNIILYCDINLKRNHMKKKNYTDEEFVEAVQKSKSYSGVCKFIGLSPKGGNLRPCSSWI